MRSYNGFVTVVDSSNSMADILVGMVKPRPPSLGGKDRSSPQGHREELYQLEMG